MFTHSPLSPQEQSNASFISEQNSTNITRLSALVNETKVADSIILGTTYTDTSPPREFPLPLVVASSVAAVSILIFFCVAYYWHSYQLDKRAQELAIRRAAEDAEAQLHPRRRPRHPRRKHGARSLDLPSPTVNGPKKSTAITDQEILTHFASRRQSIFF